MPSILIVDDDDIQRRLAGHLVKPVRDLDVSYAQDGASALAAVAQHVPDIVLTDLNMPGMNGLELVGALRDKCPGIPIILMTSSGSEQIAVKAIEAGATSYVPKSDLKANLQETVEKLLGVVAARKNRLELLRYLKQGETQFELDNDANLIPPLIGFFHDNIERLGFGSESIRMDVGMALMEALTNAMFHGNLEVSSDLRRQGQEAYEEAIRHRRNIAPYASRRVHVTARESHDRIIYIIRDEGPGFDPKSLPDPTSAENMEKLCGRGLLMMRAFMDKVEHNDKGNQITLTKLINGGK